MGEGQEVTSRFLVACGDAAVVLEAVDQALDKVSTLVFLPVVPPLNDSVFQRLNDRLGVSLPQQAQKSVRIIGPVGNDCSRLMLPHEQLRLTRKQRIIFIEALAKPITGIKHNPLPRNTRIKSRMQAFPKLALDQGQDLSVVEPMTMAFHYAEGLPRFKDRIHCIPEAAPGLKTLADAFTVRGAPGASCEAWPM